MEEEGIPYFFRHNAQGHQLILANRSEINRDVPFDQLITFRGNSRASVGEDVITEFERPSRSFPAKSHCGIITLNCRTSTSKRPN